MFVSSNTVQAARAYFLDRLKEQFSHRELRFMFQISLQKRLKKTASEVLFMDEERLSESDLLFFRSIVKRLQENEPFQHIIGETEFYGLQLKTDARALIPRPETEELVAWVVEDYSEKKELSIVDICTGTGCIALAVKHVFGNNTIVKGVDISVDALALAKENADALNLEIEWIKLDVLQEDLPFADASLDVLISNPPYITNKEKMLMAENVLSFEPHLALFVADETPLVFYRRIAEQALQKLKIGGALYFEINEHFGQEMVQLGSELGFNSCELRQDLQGKDRMLKLVR